MTGFAGFMLAAQDSVDLRLLAATLSGIALVIAAACVINNYLDRGIDAKMTRTKRRALVDGSISVQAAWLYATILGGAGFTLLALGTNWLTLAIGVVAFVDYIALYGYAKRHSVHSTLVGTIAGAAAPVAGYTTVTNQLDIAALLLFLIMLCWQMAHFYAIAIYRYKDYKAAGLPLMPIKYGIAATKLQIRLYITAFIISTTVLSLVNYASAGFAAIMLLTGSIWLIKSVRNTPTDDTIWARKLFLFSLIVILVFSASLAIDTTLV